MVNAPVPPAAAGGGPAAAAGPGPAAAGGGPAAAAALPPAAAGGGPAAAAAAGPSGAVVLDSDSDDDSAGSSSPSAAAATATKKKKKIQVYYPKTRFNVKQYTFFVERFSHSGPMHTEGIGFWITPYTMKSVDDDTGAPHIIGVPYPKHSQAGEVDTPIYTAVSGVTPIPAMEAIPYVHFLPADAPMGLCTVGAMYLKFCLETAEKADHDFALRMQGLQHCSINAVWCCPDDAYEGSDREDASKRYAERYVRRFLEGCGVSGETKSADVVKDTLQMQRDFADGWTREHTHTLSPLVESAGEALITMFIPSALSNLRGLEMSPKELFRALRRNQEFSAQIGLCLHHFMVKLEQDRGGRNANYKSMFNASTSNMLALGALAKLFKLSTQGIYDTLKSAQERDQFFHPLLVDWYDIFRQMPVARSEAPSVRR